MADHELLTYATTPGLTGDFLTKVTEKAERIGDIETLVALARHENLTRDDRARLANHSDGVVRAACIGSHLMDIDDVEAHAHDSHPQVRFEVARHPGVSQTFLKGYLSDEAIIKIGLCENPDLLVEDLRILCQDPDDTVREKAVETAEERGIRLEHVVRTMVLQPATGVDVNVLLGSGLDGRLQATMLDTLDDDVRERLLEDESPVVSARFATRPDLTPDEKRACARHSDPTVRAAYAGNPAADPAERDAMAFDPEAAVRAGVARHTADPVLQKRFARDDLKVRRTLAGRIETISLDAVGELAKDDDPKIRRQVALNRSEPERLDNLLVRELREWKVGAWQERLYELVDPKAHVQAIVLSESWPGSLVELTNVANALK